MSVGKRVSELVSKWVGGWGSELVSNGWVVVWVSE